MPSKIVIAICCTLLLGFYPILPTHADVKLAYIDQGMLTPERLTVIQVQADKVRMGDDQSTTYSIFDNTQQTLYTINPELKQYTITSKETLKQQVERIHKSRQQLKQNIQEQIAQLPFTDRQIAEKRLRQAEIITKLKMPKLTEVTTPTQRTILGIPCVVTELRLNGQVMREVCNANNALTKEDFSTLLAMFEFMDNIANALAKAQGKPSPHYQTSQAHAAGLALQINSSLNTTRNELVYISQQALDKSEFEIPKTFQVFQANEAD